ncbi:hypothetical protein J2Y69_001835 [Microbacterium resistens]|uniref:DUF4012 domain-containing protein n=1 Tax=Microbacterium resistens TaxID=156977 RepID=A0ABU1SCA0_9MICO|nr:DUF4012 domain-containing protein [Microbacterium resistens]MDR6867234.1 hypothetical protein [Microbacterium resistens]
MKSARFWVPVSVGLVLIGVLVGGGFVAKHLYDQAMSAKGDLEQAFPLVTEVEKSMLAGDVPSAQATAARIAALTTSAAKKTDTPLWHGVEWVPFAGPNLAAVRIAADSADTLATDVLTPLTSVSLDALLPKDGAFDTAQLDSLATLVGNASQRIEGVRTDLGTIDQGALIPQVSTGVSSLTAALDKIDPYLTPVHNALTLLPKALGAETPRNYLLLFQNNAESRGTGGNPASIAMLTADHGAISMTQQASSQDFTNGRPAPIIPLDPQTEALYGTKIARYIQDTTLSPDFGETAAIVRAFWAESYGTPIDAVASIDPVALAYILQAIGPVQLPTGETLTADNAIPLLLNEVYTLYPEPADQDVFFAGAAGAVFNALLHQTTDPKALLDVLAKAAGEGRLLYSPSDPAEAAIIAGSPVSGTLPDSNADATAMGVYVNDVTEGKLDYYMQLDIAADSTQCQAGTEAPTFGITATLTNTLTPEQAPGLAPYVSPGRFYTKGTVATDLVLYGPIGAEATAVTVNGNPVEFSTLPHLGRTALKVNLETPPGQSAQVGVTYQGGNGAYGPLEVRHTPMVRATPVALTAEGCGAKG